MKKFLSLFCLSVFICTMAMPSFASDHDDYIKINKDTMHLRSRLSKQYTGFGYSIKNISNEDICIETISLKDSVTGQAAYLSLKRSSLAEAAGTIGTGLVYALPTLTLSLWGSIILAPIKMIGNSLGNTGAKQEGKRYDTAIPTQLTLKPNNSVKIKTLGVHRNPPTITIIYKPASAVDVMTFEYQ